MFKITYVGLKLYEREISSAITVVQMILSSDKDYVETERIGIELLNWVTKDCNKPWKYFFITGDIVVEYV